MKTVFIRILIIIAAVWTLNASAQQSLYIINDNDRAKLFEAIDLIDSCKNEDAIKILDNLSNKYIDNYIIEYERLYAYYLNRDYGVVVEQGPKLFNYPESEPIS